MRLVTLTKRYKEDHFDRNNDKKINLQTDDYVIKS